MDRIPPTRFGEKLINYDKFSGEHPRQRQQVEASAFEG